MGKAERQKKYAGVNLYIKQLSDIIDDDRLRQEFSEFGHITSAVVMRDKAGKSKGFGFVCYSSSEEATKAIKDMNGRMLDGKPLYVALAQRFEERKRLFEPRLLRGMPKGPQPMYPVPMGPPRIYGQMIHPGWANQPMAVPNRMGGPHYALMPASAAANRNGGGNSRRGGRGRGANQQGNGQRGQNFKYAENVRNQRQQPQQAAPAVPAAADTTPEEDFVRELAALPEAKRKHVIGDRLYPLVHNFQPDQAPKITGMLLEMENTEIIELLGSSDALEKKIQEALHVLKESEAAE